MSDTGLTVGCMSFVSSGTAGNVGAKAKSAAEAVLGTGADTADTAYDMKSGALLTFVLLFALGWIPILGQMVSGYVGGRRSGSPVRGLAATGAATVCVLIVLTVISFILYSVNGALADDPAAEIAAVSATSPVLGQLMSAGVGYLQAVFGSTTGFGINYGVYMITVAFGLVGGVIADQSRKETRLIIASAGNAPARRIRSVELHRAGRSMGFQCYEDYLPMSVNSMTPTPKPAQDVRPAETKAAPVTVTVDVKTPSGTTPTSVENQTQKGNPFADILSKSDRKTEQSEHRDQNSDDDMQYI